MTNGTDCYVCDWLSKIHGSEERYFVAELETGYFFISKKWQYFYGYSFFISKTCVKELHQMPVDFRRSFLFEMTVVSEAVQNVLGAEKMNCESLGNSCPHVHWHIIPRYGNDPYPDKAIWSIDRDIIDSRELSDNELVDLKTRFVAEMKRLAEKYSIKVMF